MERKTINLKSGADLPYSSAVVASGRFVFVSGHVGFDPVTGEPPEGIEAQTRQSLENIKAVLEAAGTSLALAVKVNVYLVNAGDYDVMNTVYKEYFPVDRPARATVVTTLVRPDLLVEIEMTALMPDGEQP